MKRYLPLLFLAGCTSSPPPSPVGEPTDIDSVLGSRAAASTLAGSLAYGRFRVIHGKSACRSSNIGEGNPMVWPSQKLPKVGEPMRVEWTLNPSVPFEDRPCYLLVSFEPANIDLTPLGFRGCHMFVAPPEGNRQLHALAPQPGSILTQQDGRVYLDWTPGSAFAGRKMYSQLVVYSPGANARDWLWSPGLETWVGQ